MGTYFNPGNESFFRDSSDECYIDKTGLLAELNKRIGTIRCCIALSHARRFGKTQAAGMIDAYYSMGCDSKALFSGFEIAKTPDFEKHLNQYHVIHLDISSVSDFHKEDLVDAVIERICDDLKKFFEDQIDCNRDINRILNDVYDLTQIKIIIVIDEWDCVIRNHSDRPDLVHRYLQFLHALFKSEESKKYLALGYMTGILPIKKIRDESALNNFSEYSMLSSKRFTRYFGFTDDEVKSLCLRYEMDYESVRKWYDGYLIDNMQMYNPNSVCCAMTEHALESYWKNTSSFQTINDLIALNISGLKEDVLTMLKGEKVFANVNTFQNDLSLIHTKDDALTALIHLGYLGYDAETGEVFIPNFEVALHIRKQESTIFFDENLL